MSYLNWYVGMKVVAIEPVGDPEPPNPVYGEVYTISWIGVADDGTDDILIDLVELPNPESPRFMRGYEATGFRPAQTRKADISVFTAMLRGTKGKVRA